MSNEKIQTVFLLDTSSLPAKNLQQYFRLLCLVCTRILLFLSQFPNKEHLRRVRWNYKFFNSQRPEKSVRAKTAQFYECRSEFLQSFFGKLQNGLEAAWGESEPAASSSTSNPAKRVYSALASAVHDFIWDAPEILSPVRPISGRNQKGVRGRRSGGEEIDVCRNLIFICSPCPNSKDELNGFCSSESSFEGRGRGRNIVMECLRSELLPRALLTQLTARGIAVHWVDTTGTLSSSEARPEGVYGSSLMSELLESTGGTVIPSSALVSPLCTQLMQDAWSSHTSARDCSTTANPHPNHSSETVLPVVESTGTVEESDSQTVRESSEVNVIPIREQHTTAMADAANPTCNSHSTAIHSVPHSPSQHSGKSNPHTGDATQHISSHHEATGEPTRDPIPMTETKSKSKNSRSLFPSQEFLATLVLPASAQLKEYLQQGSAKKPLSLMEGNCLYWLCTKAGKILCILEAHPLHPFVGVDLATRQGKPAPPRAEKKGAQSIQGAQEPNSSESQTDSKTARHYRPTYTDGEPSKLKVPQTSKKRKIRKKLSFSLADRKSKSSSSHTPTEKPASSHLSSVDSVEESSCSKTIQTIPDQPDSACVVENSSTRKSQRDHSIHVPHAVAVGLVRQCDIPLNWLSAVNVYCCVGLYVPKQVRSKPLKTSESNATPAISQSVPVSQHCALSSQKSHHGRASSPSESSPPEASRTFSEKESLEVSSSQQLEKFQGISKPGNSPPLSPPSNASVPMSPKTPVHQAAPSSSPYYQALHSSPQIHLFRHPVTPPSRASPSSQSTVNQLPITATHVQLRRSPRLQTGFGSRGRVESPGSSFQLEFKSKLRGEVAYDMGNDSQHPTPNGNNAEALPRNPEQSPCTEFCQQSDTSPKARGTLLHGLLEGRRSPRVPFTPNLHPGLSFGGHAQSPSSSSFLPASTPPTRKSPRLALKPSPDYHALNSGQNMVDRGRNSSCIVQTSSSPHVRQQLRSPSLSPKQPVIHLTDVLASRRIQVQTSICASSSKSDPNSNPQLQVKANSEDKNPPIPSEPLCVSIPLPSASVPSQNGHEPTDYQGLPPWESLALSGRYHSRQYQNLCLWLARNGLLLLVGIRLSGDAGYDYLGVLQPATSLVATLSLIRPQYCARLMDKLAAPPRPVSTAHQSLLYGDKQYPAQVNAEQDSVIEEGTRLDKRIQLTAAGQQEFVMHQREAIQPQTHSEEGAAPETIAESDSKVSRKDAKITSRCEESLSSNREVSVDTSDCIMSWDHREREECRTDDVTVAAQYASDPEIYVSLQLLFHAHKAQCHMQKEGPSPLHSLLLHSLTEASPFTSLSLLPWFPYLQTSGVSPQMMAQLKQLQEDARASKDGAAQRKARLLAALQSLYSSGRVSTSVGEGEGSELMETELMYPPEDATGTDIEPHNEKDPGEPQRPATLEELFEKFQLSYAEKVNACDDGESMQLWAYQTMSSLKEDFLALLATEGSEGSHSGGLQLERLWGSLNERVLLTAAQLKEKYGETGQKKDSYRRRIAEYQLQVLLYFEAMRLCCDAPYNPNTVADELILLLRRISLLADPGFLGHCMKRVILPNYTTCCGAVLAPVCEGLMLPLPPELHHSPGSGPSSPLAASSDSETALLSLQEPSAPRLTDITAKSLAKRMSFQDVHSQRQITVPARKGKKRKKYVASKDDLELQRRFSVSIPNVVEETTEKGKRVCRSLFSRSQSISYDVGSKRKREPDEPEKPGTKKQKSIKRHHTLSDVIVMETPLKKQQVGNYRRYKLQRLRSKAHVECSPGLAVIEESPRRSFYSAPKVHPSKSSFKTPPLKHKHLSPKVILNKEPSPAALHSLLHGQMVSPTAPGTSQVSPSLFPVVTESPDLFDYKNSGSACEVPGSKAARMLTYETENPLLVSSSVAQTPQKAGRSKNTVPSEQDGAVCFLTDLDPSIENESASMVAFALCTPTKDDPRNFQQAFQHLGD